MQPDRIKLLKMLTSFHIGGTERQVANLTLRIDSSRFDLHLACLRYSGQLLEELKTLAIPRPEFRIGSFYSPKTFWQGMRFAQYIRKNRIQIVHSYGFYSNVFAVPAARLARTAIVVASIRDTGDVLTSAQRQVQRMICKAADCVLVNAEAIREALIKEGYPPHKIVVIRNGIMLSKFGKRQRGGLLRQELGLPLTAYIRVRPDPGQLPRVAELARSIPEVVECHRITGEDCFILKAHFPAIDQLDRLLDQFLVYGNTTTSIVQSTPVPLRLPPLPQKKNQQQIILFLKRKK